MIQFLYAHSAPILVWTVVIGNLVDLSLSALNFRRQEAARRRRETAVARRTLANYYRSLRVQTLQPR